MVFTSNSVGLSPKKCFKLIFRLTKLICMTFEAITNDITRFQTQLKVVVSDLRTAPLNLGKPWIMRILDETVQTAATAWICTFYGFAEFQS